MIGVPKRQDGMKEGVVKYVWLIHGDLGCRIRSVTGTEMDLDGHGAGLLSSVSPVGQTGSGYPTDVSNHWLPHYPTLQATTLILIH